MRIVQNKDSDSSGRGVFAPGHTLEAHSHGARDFFCRMLPRKIQTLGIRLLRRRVNLDSHGSFSAAVVLFLSFRGNNGRPNSFSCAFTVPGAMTDGLSQQRRLPPPPERLKGQPAYPYGRGVVVTEQANRKSEVLQGCF